MIVILEKLKDESSTVRYLNIQSFHAYVIFLVFFFMNLNNPSRALINMMKSQRNMSKTDRLRAKFMDIALFIHRLTKRMDTSKAIISQNECMYGNNRL